MNTKNKRKWFGMGCGIFLAAMMAMNLIAAEVNTDTITVPTAVSATTNNALTATTGTAWRIAQPNTGLNLLCATTATQSTNAMPIVVGFDGSPDNTTWTTTAPLRATNTANGTTTVIGTAYFTADQLKGFKYLRAGYLNSSSATAVQWTAVYPCWTF